MSSTTPSIGIVTVVKNEAPYLVEWLAHHRLLGIKNFFIADNDSNDGTTELLKNLQNAGLVVYHKFQTPAGCRPHVPALDMLLERHRDDVDWLAIIDADEFIWPTENNSSLHSFIASFQNNHPQAGAIVLNWATYGSSHNLLFQDDLVVKRFIYHAAKDKSIVNRHIKSILRPKAIQKILSPHYATLEPGWQHLHANGMPFHPIDHSVPPEHYHNLSSTVIWEPFRINHYVIKSYQEFIQKKQQRGRAFTNFLLDDQFFMGHDFSDSQSHVNDQYLAGMAREISHLMQATPDFDHAYSTRNLLENQEQFLPDLIIPQIGYIDAMEIGNEQLNLVGWVLPFSHQLHPVSGMEARIDSGPWEAAISCSRLARPDVQQHYPHAPHDCGFTANFPVPTNLNKSSRIEARGVTSTGLRTTSITCATHARNQRPTAHVGD